MVIKALTDKNVDELLSEGQSQLGSASNSGSNAIALDKGESTIVPVEGDSKKEEKNEPEEGLTRLEDAKFTCEWKIW